MPPSTRGLSTRCAGILVESAAASRRAGSRPATRWCGRTLRFGTGNCRGGQSSKFCQQLVVLLDLVVERFGVAVRLRVSLELVDYLMQEVRPLDLAADVRVQAREMHVEVIKLCAEREMRNPGDGPAVSARAGWRSAGAKPGTKDPGREEGPGKERGVREGARATHAAGSGQRF